LRWQFPFVARHAFQKVMYSNIAGEKRPAGPTTLSSETLERGIARGLEFAFHAPCSVVSANLNPASASMLAVSGDQFPLGYAKVSHGLLSAFSIAVLDSRTSRRAVSSDIVVRIWCVWV